MRIGKEVGSQNVEDNKVDIDGDVEEIELTTLIVFRVTSRAH